MKRLLRLLGAGVALIIRACTAFYLYGARQAQQAVPCAGLPIDPVYQFDYPAVVCFAAGENKSVATSGCGATCMSMVIEYLTDDSAQTPQTLFEDAWRRGDYYGYGLSHDAMDRLARQNGVSGKWIGKDAETLRRALNEGCPVIAHMGPGQFAEEGHYILLRGLDEDGRVVLNDPNSRENTKNVFSLEQIIAEAKTNTPFMVCRLAKRSD